MSAVSAIGYARNLANISATVFNKHGTGYKQLFKETPELLAAEASYTTRTFVVSLSALMTGWCGN